MSDFDVYFSNALVNGKQDHSIIATDTSIIFEVTLSELGEKYLLEYDVTNGSKLYDANLEMTCTEGNEYLKVSNEFDTNSPLISLTTRRGILTIELIKSYAGDELETRIQCEIGATALEKNSIGEGNVQYPASQTFYVGKEIAIDSEKFNVISENENTITMLAQYNLDENYRQSKIENYVNFSDIDGWENTPGPKEIDIQLYDGPAKTYVNEYVVFLQNKLNDNTIVGDLAALKELGTLGCTYPSNYEWYQDYNERTCKNSEHFSWLINGQRWWTKSVSSVEKTHIWNVSPTDVFRGDSFIDANRGIRPVITVSKEVISKYLAKTVKILTGDGTNIGDEIAIGNEKFYVLSNDGINLELFAKHGLFVGGEYDVNNKIWTLYENNLGLQNSTMIGWNGALNNRKGVTAFSNDEIKGEKYSSYEGSIVEGYVNDYSKYIKDVLKIENEATLISLDTLKKLGCSVEERKCLNSDYSWIYTSSYWTKTASSDTYIYRIGSDNHLSPVNYDDARSFVVRPVIIISADLL